MRNRKVSSGGRSGPRRALAAALLIAASIAAIDAPLAQSGPSTASTQRNFSVPAGPLAPALVTFGRQAGLQVSYVPSIAAGLTTSGVTGTLATDVALSRLLAGTGLAFQVTASKTVVIERSGAGGTNATVPGAIALDTIDVSGGGSNTAADAPYQTPGSSAHVSREELDRVPPISAGDVFRTTPGVISAGNRVGTSINPNIRGLQGMGRVNTTVDGARQNTSTYRGYIGNRDETYIDPDMVGGIDISKGPSEGAGVGGIGGTVNFRTLEARDIVKDGQTTGTRIKTSIGSNTSKEPEPGAAVSSDRPSVFGDTFSGSFATATVHENYEAVAAYSKRKSGNYFAGTKVPDGMVFGAGTSNANAQVRPGQEVFNTSEDTESFLAKGKVKSAEQSLELGYLFYGSRSGQISDLFLTTGLTNTQYPLTNTHVDTYTAKYRYTPSDNPFVNLRANLWLSDLAVDRFLATIEQPYGTRTIGGDIGNTSVVTTALGKLTLDNGLEFVREHATAEQFATTATRAGGWMTYGPSGVRLMTSVFSNASLQPTDWLTVSGGARYDHYNSEGEGYLTRFPERSGERVSPRAGLLLTPLQGVQLYAQYTEGYRPPSLRESHWHFEALLLNNPNVRPEVAKNKEVGLNILRNDVALTGDKLRFKASYFDNHYDDYLIRLQLPRQPGFPGNQYNWANMDSATFRGFELSGGYDARAFFFEGAFTKYTNIEYCLPNGGMCSPPKIGTAITGPSSSPIATDYVSNYVPPEYSGSFTVGMRAFDEKLTLGARMHFASVRAGSTWTGGSSSRVGIDVSWPEYRIFDVFGSYKLTDDATVNFSLENITDEYYFGALSSVGIPSPGRTARIGLTNTLGGNAVPSVPDLTLGRAAEGTPGSNWTGLYFGGHLGYGFADISGTTTAANGAAGGIPATESANLNLDDLTRGVQAGFNQQFANRVVIGVEGDFSWTKLYGTQQARATEGTLAQGGWLQAETDYQFDWSATLRGRVGYAFDQLLVYGTAGLAFVKEAQLRTQYQSDSASASLPAGRFTAEFLKESSGAVRSGWTVGGGFEYALTNHWSLTGQYLYSGFGKEDFLFPNARAGVTRTSSSGTGTSTIINGRNASNELDLHTLKFGVNYRF